SPHLAKRAWSRSRLPTSPDTWPGARPRKLDAPGPLRVQAAVTMSGPFRQNITNLVDKVDGAVAAVLMGFDGITVDSFAKPGHDGALPDIQTLAMEFAHLIAQARRTLQSLNAGALEEFTLRAESLTLVV